jgi:hypothetical protein
MILPPATATPRAWPEASTMMAEALRHILDPFAAAAVSRREAQVVG